MIRLLLNACGPVLSWKRVQGATGKLQAFGFCEYSDPDAGLRAIRLLHDWEIGDKALVVKVDSKTKGVLDDYRNQRIKDLTGKTPPPPKDDDDDDVRENDDYMDAPMRHEDMMAKDRIRSILNDHSKEMMTYIPADKKRTDKRQHLPPGSVKDDGTIVYTGPKESLDDVEIEDGKRDIINREIDKFRETMKIREAEKEEEKKRREKVDEDPPPRRRRREEGSREQSIRSRSKSRDPSRSPRRREPARRYRSGSRSMSRDREWERDVRRSRRTSPSGPPRDKRRTQKEMWKEQDLEDEARERKKADRKARDKEASYQERLRKWEGREARMAKEYERDKQKEVKRLEMMDREGKKLREFLEDYDDDRDDDRYYKSDKLESRMIDREREAQRDEEDRQREKEEVEELKAQILREGHGDVAAELQRRMAIMERSSSTVVQPQPPRPSMHENGRDQEVQVIDDPEVVALSPEAFDAPLPDSPGSPGSPKNGTDPTVVPAPPSSEAETAASAAPMPTTHIGPAGDGLPSTSKQNFQVSGRKRIDVRDVFNQDDDDDLPSSKRKKLPPISQHKKKEVAPSSSSSAKMSSDEKRKHIKTLIDKIPTDKNALFEYAVDWDMVDQSLIEKRIRPWVNKKIAEYIGEPEPTLTDFICSKVLAGSTPKAVLEDVQMVLDEEAEVFVVKMWRLLIYEIESKKFKSSGTA